MQESKGYAKAQAECLCEEGEYLLKLGRHEDAGEKFELALRCDQGSARAHSGLGRFLYRGLKEADRAMGEARSHGMVRLRYEDIDRVRKLMTRTIEEMETALKLGASSADLHADLGDMYGLNGRTGEGEEQLARALQLDPKHGRACFTLGMLRLAQKRYPEAIEHLRIAVIQLREEPEVHFELGRAYFSNRQFAESVPCYEKAIDLNPRYTDALYNLGSALLDLGKRDKAMAMYRRFLAIEPDTLDAHRLRMQFAELNQ